MRKKIAAMAGLVLAVAVATAAFSPAFALGEAEGGGAAGADAVALGVAKPEPIGAAAPVAPAESLEPSAAPIEAMALTVDAPVAGGTPGTTVTVPDGAGYTAEVEGWYDPYGQLFGSFKAGWTYTVRVQVHADEDRSFSSSASVTINGSAATVTAWEGRSLFMCEKTFTVPREIEIVKLNVDKPFKYNTPSTTVTLPDGAGYTAKVEGWFERSGNPFTGEYIHAEFYTVKLSVSAVGTNRFADSVKVQVNGVQATVLEGADSQQFECTVGFYAGGDGGGCCTIVSLFGDDAPQTAKLRGFRDDTLKQSIVGEALVDLYYDVSPTVVAFLDEHPMARSAAYGAIDAFASMIPAREGGSL